LQSIAGFLLNPAAGKGGASEKGITMSSKCRRAPAKFAPERGFKTGPTLAEPRRARQAAELERLKARLLAARQAGGGDGLLEAQVSLAATDAAALAWVTQYPLLLFPVLFEEMADIAALRTARQEQIRQRSRELLAA
jgi:hypothetical protein